MTLAQIFVLMREAGLLPAETEERQASPALDLNFGKRMAAIAARQAG